MLRASETSRCRAESRFIAIDFAEASHCSFLFTHLMRSIDFAWDDKNPIFLSAPLSCWASRGIALPLILVYFSKSLFAMLFCCDAKLHLCSLENALRASLYI